MTRGALEDVRLAFPALRAARIVSAVAVLSLALGIGATTARFSRINSLLLRALPFRAPLLYGVEPADPGNVRRCRVHARDVAALAGWGPAARASRIDPAAVLRNL